MTDSKTVYFVTGASRGIGREFIKQLVTRPDSIVFAAARNPADVKKQYPTQPPNLHIVQCDVTSDTSISAAAETVKETVGRVDVLINNAAIDNNLSIRDTPTSSLLAVLDTNLLGVHRVTRAFLPLVEKSKVKKIINISSDFGSVALNDRSFWGAYNISKAALNMLTIQYKNEYFKEGIIFIPLHPGNVFTDMNEHDANITTEESVQGIMKVVDKVTIEDSGKYYTNEGTILPW